MLAGTLVIIPSYNEAESAPQVIAQVLQLYPGLRVLLVDDNSPDGTADLVERSFDAKRVQVLRRHQKAGLGPAYLAGFDWALSQGFDRIVQLDGDGSHRPEHIGELLAALDSAEFVIGSRLLPGGAIKHWRWYRRWLSLLGNRYARWALRSQLHDLTSGFRALRSSAIASLLASGGPQISSAGYCFQVETALLIETGGHSVAEVPITFVQRIAGKSKMSLGIVAEAMWKVTVWGLTGRFRP